MIKIETVYTEEEARQMLAGRGLVVEMREAVAFDGEREIPIFQLQVYNPFARRWEAMRDVFRNGMQQVVEELQREKFTVISIDKIFNHVDE